MSYCALFRISLAEVTFIYQLTGRSVSGPLYIQQRDH